MILVNPPVVKASEPPAGIAALAGALSAHGVPHTVVDGSLEAMLWLLGSGPAGPLDTFTKRALAHLPENLAFLRDWRGYAEPARYRKAVLEVNRVAAKAAGRGSAVSLADYGDVRFSPAKSGDLLEAARRHRENLFYPYFSERLSRLVEEGHGTAVGFSLNYLSQAVCTFAMAGFLRERYPEVKIVLGGGLVTAWMSRKQWRSPFGGLIDHMVSGPGEPFLLSLAGIQAETGRACPSFDALPFGSYFAPGPVLPYAASRGCYWRRCSFCPEKAQGLPFSPKAATVVARELALLSERHEAVLIHLVDNAVSPRLMTALAATPPGKPWYGFARVTPELSDLEYCRRLKASGCAMLKLGVESGDQALLDATGKGTRVEAAAGALASLKAAGIATYVYLLFGTPAEDLAAARRTLEFAARESASIDYLNLAVFNLPAGCDEAARLRLRPFYAGDLPLYTDFVHPRGFGRREVRLFLEHEMKAHPAIRPILQRRPPFFTSNHAPLLEMGRKPEARR